MRFMKGMLFLLIAAPTVVQALDTGVDFYIAQNTIRKIILTVDGLQVLTVRMYQINYSAQLSQDLGEYWNLGCSATGINAIATNGIGVVPVPEQTAFSGTVTFNPSDNFQVGLEYNLTGSVYIERVVYAETLIESEPDLFASLVLPFCDWFDISSSFSLGYYFSPYSRGFGASLSVMPEFIIKSWALTLGIPVTAGYYLQGYRGVSESGFDGVTPSLSVSWSPGDVFTLSLSAGFYFSLSRNPGERILNSAPYYQLDLGFFLSGDSDDSTGNGNTNN